MDDIEFVRKEVLAWEKNRNNKNAKVKWQFTTEDARIKLSRLYPTFEIDVTLAIQHHKNINGCYTIYIMRSFLGQCRIYNAAMNGFLYIPPMKYAEDGIRTHELLRDRTLNPAPLTWLGDLRASLQMILIT